MDIAYRDDVKAVLDEMLGGLPDVKIGKAFGYPAYKLGRKVFAFVGGDGIAIKLTEDRVRELTSEHDFMSLFEPTEGTVWKAWVSIDRDNVQDYQQDRGLLDEAMRLLAEA